jgi:BlaI family penicillinase repressor
MKPKKTVPTDQELEILKVVWQRGRATVREVYRDLAAQRKIAYTTVLTMMGGAVYGPGIRPPRI